MVTTRTKMTYKTKIECSVVIVRHPDDYFWDIRCAWHRRPMNANFFPGTLELPGGKRQRSESFLRAAYRELREETGLRKQDLCKPLHCIAKIRVPPTRDFGLQLIFETTTNVPIHEWKSEDGTPWEWHDPNELLDSDMYSLGPNIRKAIQTCYVVNNLVTSSYL
jgi:8-oxo-dGTP pyrophosphatase MutT (NUDIX family)